MLRLGGLSPSGGTRNKFFVICTRGEVVNILGRNPRTAGSNPAVYSKKIIDMESGAKR